MPFTLDQGGIHETYLAASFHFPPDIPKVLPQLKASQPHLKKKCFMFKNTAHVNEQDGEKKYTQSSQSIY